MNITAETFAKPAATFHSVTVEDILADKEHARSATLDAVYLAHKEGKLSFKETAGLFGFSVNQVRYMIDRRRTLIARKHLDPMEKAALRVIKNLGEVTAGDVGRKVDLSEKAAGEMLSAMRDKGLLSSVNMNGEPLFRVKT